ncbi:fumarate reductase/succinate dehydrogenase flavoprotein domain protein [Parafrankia sp. EAN1pec]|uniref:FAD-dependent oxidoreductase n=1 Tax=Parafrankia sp. (strain EAN1pec) TaxID=298653 RepID=UPI0000544671|nr:fumarate reductase/succinate dehydrogenase flavoprotein domain protein [Frankia sp. EAN1pec]
MLTITDDNDIEYDGDVDVLVAGSGAGGLSTAVTAASAGRSVLVLERADRLGGTTRKSAAGVWIPNNRFLQAAGIEDDRLSALRYLARIGRPALYDPASPTLGLPEWEYNGLAGFYDYANEAIEALEKLDALHLAQATNGLFDYLEYVAENKTPQGRGLYQADSMGSAEGGQLLIDGFVAAAARLGVELRSGHRVIDVIVDSRRVVGVVVQTVDGVTLRLHARLGIVFATGGFTHNPDLRLQFLDGPYVGGCAAPTNTGDFVTIASELGAELANMSQGWAGPIVIERLLKEPEDVFCSFYTLGDSLLTVNCSGVRVMNEKAPYNEAARVMAAWNPATLRYENFPLITIWDQQVADRWPINRLGNPVPTTEDDPYWVVSGCSVAELAENIDTRLAELAPHVGRRRLDAGFAASLDQTLQRFGGFADRGVDEDFHRGDTRFERYVSARFGDGDGPNPLLRRLDTSGPLYATIVGPGLLDTKGGPRTDLQGRVLGSRGTAIEGLFAVGNAAAAPSGQGYPGAGGTLGPIITYGYLAGRFLGSADIEPHEAGVQSKQA